MIENEREHKDCISNMPMPPFSRRLRSGAWEHVLLFTALGPTPLRSSPLNHLEIWRWCRPASPQEPDVNFHGEREIERDIEIYTETNTNKKGR